ncbi:MAG: hypothetical protein IPG90_17850 [Bacteroidetes bacterium]|nr:hypothetical protein [Bacteroidota bacterium]
MITTSGEIIISDNHALWINPADPNQLMVGCDGGIYNTNDAGANWEFRSNLPVTQFYKVSTDNAVPFYNVFGGTQDNNSLVGPSRRISSNGITNSDWKITLEGDGFETQVDPENRILFIRRLNTVESPDTTRKW